MLFCTQIRNFDDFDARFGYKKDLDGNYLVNRNGIRQRKNLIPYLMFKESFYYWRKKGYSLTSAMNKAIKLDSNQEVFEFLTDQLNCYGLSIEEDSIIFSRFKNYQQVEQTLSPNKDINSIYYLDRINGKYYSMKIGRFIQHFIDWVKTESDDPILNYWLSNSRICAFFIEELTERWKNIKLKLESLQVIVDFDFEAIYSFHRRNENNRNFNSCMDDKPNWQFYTANPHIFKAVSLQDSSGNIYARALLINCIGASSGKDYTLLERIYCNKRMYKDLLFEKVKEAKICNIYKDLEASCKDYNAIKDITTEMYIEDILRINFTFNDGDVCAYQDTFKFYYPDRKFILNRPIFNNFVNLATTQLNYSISWENN